MDTGLLVGLIGIAFTLVSTSAGLIILIYRVNAQTNLRVDQVYADLGGRIEALRIETKDDRHNYVGQIDHVLNALKEDIHEVDLKVTSLVASNAALASLRNGGDH